MKRLFIVLIFALFFLAGCDIEEIEDALSDDFEESLQAVPEMAGNWERESTVNLYGSTEISAERYELFVFYADGSGCWVSKITTYNGTERTPVENRENLKIKWGATESRVYYRVINTDEWIFWGYVPQPDAEPAAE